MVIENLVDESEADTFMAVVNRPGLTFKLYGLPEKQPSIPLPEPRVTPELTSKPPVRRSNGSSRYPQKIYVRDAEGHPIPGRQKLLNEFKSIPDNRGLTLHKITKCFISWGQAKNSASGRLADLTKAGLVAGDSNGVFRLTEAGLATTVAPAVYVK